ncbi:hypothetical protein MTO96_048169 [Rhipicephalus appendiculatus]
MSSRHFFAYDDPVVVMGLSAMFQEAFDEPSSSNATPESTVGATAAEGAVEATTREVMMQVGTATAATTMPVVAASEAVASVGEPATPTAEPQPQEGMDLDEAVQPFSIRIAFLDED